MLPVRLYQLASSIGNEITFVLPKSEVDKFPTLFRGLEEQKRELGLGSYGVSMTTMEDVYLKVTAMSDSSLIQGKSEVSILMEKQKAQHGDEEVLIQSKLRPTTPQVKKVENSKSLALLSGHRGEVLSQGGVGLAFSVHNVCPRFTPEHIM